MQTVICMKWGTRYGADFVNRLHAAILRNTARPTQLVCLTDDPTGVNPNVRCEPIPDINLPDELVVTPWRKLVLWKDGIAGLCGDILFLDLDLVITGSLDNMFDFEPGRFCVIENWTQPGKGIGNTSCFRWPVGKHSYIFDKLSTERDRILSDYRIEQVYISREVDDMVFWPRLWCASFKHTLLPRWPMNFFKAPALPSETKIVAFTGKPDQDEAAVGKWPVTTPWKRLYKHVRPTAWITEHW
ncbi:hypothetical protein GCM10011309_05030 [Litorimonas cladophorae]|uniref:Glycosyltransferase n=2 Tax=Litorimonas cladophorae TaxID=1220491 RepID=A0A918KE46_9PROT|nr:hypothetical protein GCM10011309_05030 [Litorimonas cladophorae]